MIYRCTTRKKMVNSNEESLNDIVKFIYKLV